MYTLVNDILDFYQLQEGKFVYSFTEFNLHTLLREVHDLMSYNIKSKGLEFSLEFNQRILNFSDETSSNNDLSPNL
jgi:signal transduction histidine kinase